MASLRGLDENIILEILANLHHVSDLVAVSLLDRRFHKIVTENPQLFHSTDPLIRCFGLIYSVVAGDRKTTKLILDSGIDPNDYHCGPTAQDKLYLRQPGRGSSIVDESDEQLDQIEEAEFCNDEIRCCWEHRRSWDDWYATPIHFAAYYGHDDIVSLLVDYGANLSLLSVGICCCWFSPQLYSDITNGDTELAPHPAAVRPASALHLALCGRHISTARRIIKSGAPLHLG
ncbi:uncharacterized protein F4822DRAFT_137906 [Hypoxylon trugodes]|uniref:uncharacterized protein n=1 Tax=Hypoxylon trugodes TaxID=326681 RepID=UPI00218D9C80|nr:uncharacterized protein F4822DRAFT_137906 [Hypoxylon trugodes]KAI1392689.1 hypothetical protein F4822DRAFT_137906 [Hypoxylon trugodes]